MMDSSEKVDKLRAACSEAFLRYPHSCSHAVWHVIQRYIPKQPHLPANSLIRYIESKPQQWREVRLQDLSVMANDGRLVVGGAVEQPNGHVVVVYPGKERLSGGYFFRDKQTGEDVKAHPYGTYALALSTSMGSWPGAISNGDKTVFDPWGAKKFKDVKFWMYVGDQR